MSKVAIFCVPGCTLAAKTIDYFKERGQDISLVVVETVTRQKFSESEQRFKVAHQEFRSLVLKSSPMVTNGKKSFARTLWLSIPERWRVGVKNLLPASISDLGDVTLSPARKWNIPLEKVARHSSFETGNLLERYGISYVLLTSSNWLIKEPLLSMKETKVINAHCAKLPQHRSLDALPWSVLENDKIGLTTHFVDAGIDTGPILSFLEVEPQRGDNLISLRERVNDKVPELFYKSIIGLHNNTITPRPQKESEGTHHRPMTVAQLLEAERLLQERINRGATSQPDPQL
jgi:folate-dependent phosphoribosylglycinamide formyltransferase PurN